MIKTLFKTCGQVAKVAEGNYLAVIIVFILLYFSITILTLSFEMAIFGHILKPNFFDWISLFVILSILAICLLGCLVVNVDKKRKIIEMKGSK